MQAVSSITKELSGRLANVPLTRAMYQLYMAKATGLLSLKHVEAQKKIYFENGNIVYVMSNSVLEAIGQFLLKRKHITEMDLSFGLENQKQEGGSLISALIRLGKLNKEDAFAALSEQALYRITEAASWTSGRYYFTPNEKATAIKVPYGFNVYDALVACVEENFDIIRLKNLFAPVKEEYFEAQGDVLNIIKFLSIREEEMKAAEQISREPFTPFSYLKACAAAKVVPLYALRLLYMLIQVEFVKHLPQGVAAPPPIPVAAQKYSFEKSSPEVTVPDFLATTQPPELEDMPTIAEGADPELVETAENLASQNYFERLNVDKTTSDEDIKKTYMGLMKKFHPDRHPPQSADRAVCEKIVALVTQAFQGIKTTELRGEYAASIEMGADPDGVDVSNVIQAEHYFVLGMQLLKSNSLHKALENFRQCFELAPEDKSYKAYTAWTEYLLNPQDEALTEKALETMTAVNAEDVEKHDAYAFLACGKIFKQKNEMEKAAVCFRNCLRADPKNIDAKRELRLMEMRMEKEKDKAKK